MASLNPRTLQDNVAQDIDSCTTLLSLLDEEREALKNRDVDTLERIIREKAQCLTTLEHSAQQRSNIVHDLPAARQNSADQQTLWKDLLQEKSPQVLGEWEKLGELIKQCQAENEINGRLLSRNKQVFNRILSIMRGQTQSDNLYTAGGNKGAGGGGHFLGEA